MMNPRDIKSVKRFSVALALSVFVNVAALIFLFFSLIKDQHVNSRPELKVSLSQPAKTSRSRSRPKSGKELLPKKAQQKDHKPESISNDEDDDASNDLPESFSPVTEGQLASLPTPIRATKVTPVYPTLAERLGVEGDVVLRVEITKTGEVRNALVLEGIGLGADESALSAIKRYRFEPAKDRSGTAVDSVIKHVVKFRLR